MIYLLNIPSGALAIICAICGLLLGTCLAYIILAKTNIKNLNKSKVEANHIIENAYAEAKTIKKEATLEAKDESLKIKKETDDEVKERRNEIRKLEDNLLAREENILKKEDLLDKKQDNIDNLKQTLENKEKSLDNIKCDLENVIKKQFCELERISGLSKEEAKAEIKTACIEEAKIEAIRTVKDIEQEARDTANKKAQEIVTLAIQKCAADHTQEVTVSVVNIPNEDVKGRIIGREGRNIRALEQTTGVELIIDDSPETITLSGFDPIKREVARIALEKLILDGRIHPARIEELVEKVRKDIETTIKESGENACYSAGIHNMHPELIKVLGRLKYRTSYGQNCLNHSLEVSYLAGLMAEELGADVNLAKRGGLLHDVGKAVDREMEGTHVSIGVDLAKKYKESASVIHCIEAHHGGIEFKSIEAILVQAADAISSSRPGARRESLENYIKRLENIEKIANNFKGVENSFAIQAGREVRVVVRPEDISEEETYILAKDIAKKIESELEYPGQIKVNVIRETRTVEYAS